MKCYCETHLLSGKEKRVHQSVCLLKKQQQQQPQRFASGVCPDCGSTLWFESGCTHCQICGYERC